MPFKSVVPVRLTTGAPNADHAVTPTRQTDLLSVTRFGCGCARTAQGQHPNTSPEVARHDPLCVALAEDVQRGRTVVPSLAAAAKRAVGSLGAGQRPVARGRPNQTVRSLGSKP